MHAGTLLTPSYMPNHATNLYIACERVLIAIFLNKHKYIYTSNLNNLKYIILQEGKTGVSTDK